MKKKKKSEKEKTFGKYRIPLPEKPHKIIKPKKGKGSYRREKVDSAETENLE